LLLPVCVSRTFDALIFRSLGPSADMLKCYARNLKLRVEVTTKRITTAYGFNSRIFLLSKGWKQHFYPPDYALASLATWLLRLRG
jgi:hypothetical protein